MRQTAKGILPLARPRSARLYSLALEINFANEYKSKQGMSNRSHIIFFYNQYLHVIITWLSYSKHGYYIFYRDSCNCFFFCIGGGRRN